LLDVLTACGGLFVYLFSDLSFRFNHIVDAFSNGIQLRDQRRSFSPKLFSFILQILFRLRCVCKLFCLLVDLVFQIVDLIDYVIHSAPELSQADFELLLRMRLSTGWAFTLFCESGIVQTASGGSLDLNNGGDTVALTDGNATTVFSVGYDGSADGESIARDPFPSGFCRKL